MAASAIDDLVGPCAPWTTTDDVRECGPCADEDEFPDDFLSERIDIASEVLFILSGRKFSGLCEDTVRPTAFCAIDRDPILNAVGAVAAWNGNYGIGTRNHVCSNTVSELPLPGSPVAEITEVKEDGVVLAASEYRVDNNRWLVRLPDADGNRRHWRCSQRLDLAATEDYTLQVAYKFGQAPSKSGVEAVRALSCELAQACKGKECSLDRRIQSLSRQGVTIQLPGLIDALKDGHIGVPAVDLFLYTFNPTDQRSRSRVLSPDRANGTRRSTI